MRDSHCGFQIFPPRRLPGISTTPQQSGFHCFTNLPGKSHSSVRVAHPCYGRRLIGDRAEICTASTLAEAGALLADRQFDLIILDLMLPDGSGEEILSDLNRLGGHKPPVIVFSAKELSEQLKQAVSASLVKSRVTNAQLVETIRSLMPLESMIEGSNPSYLGQQCLKTFSWSFGNRRGI